MVLIAAAMGFVGGGIVVGFVWFVRSELASYEREEAELRG